MEKSESWLRELVQELGQRKIDTIVTRGGITGRAMPDPITALLDIHNTYFRALNALGLSGDRDGNAFDEAGWLLPNDAARKWLVSRALYGMDKPGIKPVDASVLQRIASTCRALEPVVGKINRQVPREVHSDRSAPLALPEMSGALAKHASRCYYMEKPGSSEIHLTCKELAALSKAWELGADTVALQTVATLDGDIITRISEQYTSEAYAVVRQIHRESVEMSLSTWDRLVNGVVGIFNGLIGRKE